MTAEQHAHHIAQLLKEAQLECRTDIGRFEDPKAQALFETIAEVLGGAMKALRDYQNKKEGVWQSHTPFHRPQPPVVTDLAVDIDENEPPAKLFTE